MKPGELIEARRNALGLSQRELALQLGIDYTYLCRIENGERLPGPKYFATFAGLLEITEDDLAEIIAKEKILQRPKINIHPPFLPPNKIEFFSHKDRKAFLSLMSKEKFNFPEDRDLIPKLLCGLQVIYDEILFGINDRKVYAGLFPDGHTYRGTTGTIAIATRQVKSLTIMKGARVSERTLTFQMLHEVAHYQLHWRPRKDKGIGFQLPDRPIYCSMGDKSPMEFQANVYASSFLMPRDEILHKIHSSKSISIEKEGRDLCNYFFVEEWMLKFRLNRLGVKTIRPL